MCSAVGLEFRIQKDTLLDQREIVGILASNCLESPGGNGFILRGKQMTQITELLNHNPRCN